MLPLFFLHHSYDLATEVISGKASGTCSNNIRSQAFFSSQGCPEIERHPHMCMYHPMKLWFHMDAGVKVSLDRPCAGDHAMGRPSHLRPHCNPQALSAVL